MTLMNEQEVEMCEYCDGASLLPATEVVNGRLACPPCRRSALHGPLAQVPDFTPAGEAQAVLDEDDALDAMAVAR